ncbi:threonine-phosphate decarboxylase CobD [Fulvimarina sp. 2208YS6-2-32]|uniref:threonine-phosphate decarboxylase n=1 Tax=Fulvimarina uroteuthidis TaxID=3098149 RepID=A0ABU5HXK5_9HYPH|nr:threonine-phosphate decarboxylase CobD [Fulvimarina sp. 2208YS6-2-32]MDY8107696.1 threonine-phosphate decarboxylase CobD [Fulvimarina sp. 2208YS6-2-32]
MIETPFKTHGGALDAAIERYGGSRADWLDLSTGINPAPPPVPDLLPDTWSRLPERAAEQRLANAARSAYGAPAKAGIAIAPGTQALISLLPYLFEPRTVAILDPTYSEHGRAFAAAGHTPCSFSHLAAIADAATIVVVVNPNNPDGKRFARRDLLDLADRLARRGGLLVVDEAFTDPEPGLSVAQETGRDGLLVLRSFGKFFGLAGLRLGFALTTPALAASLAARLGSWAVSGPALAIGTAFLEDRALIARVRVALGIQTDTLFGVLARVGLDVVGQTQLFATVHHPFAHALHGALCRRHILTRPFGYAPEWLRFGNPGEAHQALRLERALVESFAETRQARDDPARQSS